MSTTAKIGLTEISNQANAHIPLNEDVRRLDAMVQLTVIERTNTPPGSPANGDRYLTSSSPTGAWSGQANKIAIYYDGWTFVTPLEGWKLWVDGEDYTMVWDGTVWRVDQTVPGVLTTTGTGTVAVNAAYGIMDISLVGNVTFSAPTNAKAGQLLIFRLKQDGTGSRTVTWNSVYKFPGGSTPTQTSTALRTDYYEFRYNERNTTWDMVNVRQNFAT